MRRTSEEIALLLGGEVRAVRKAAKMLSRELGEATGLSQQAISSYEMGDRLVPIDKLLAVCDVLGIDICELMKKVT